MGYPKFIYAGPTTVTIGKAPADYLVLPRFKKVANTFDSGVTEVDTFHSRDIYTFRFELLSTTEKDNIITMFNAVAGGADFDWYFDRDAAKTADVIWSPNETRPQITPDPDNPTQFWSWSIELWELIT